MKKNNQIYIKLSIIFILFMVFITTCSITDPIKEEPAEGEVVSITILDSDGNPFAENQIERLAGDSIQFKVDVQIKNDASKVIMWELSGESDTTSLQYGLLKISKNEISGAILTVAARSVENPSVFGSIQVTVKVKVTEPEPDPFKYIEANYALKEFDASVCSFADKFEGNSLNLNKWGFQNGNGSLYGQNGWGNNERQSYKTENAVVEDGTLKLIAKRETYDSKNYTSAKIVTANSKGNSGVGEPAAGAGRKFGQTYGRFEAKIRMSHSFQGAWPAFWMMPVNETYGGWPRSGEIDIMEMVGIHPNNASSTLHMKPNWGTWESQYQGVTNTFQNSKTFTDWHVFGVHWNQNRMIFLLDGYETRTLERSWWNSPWYAANNFTGASAPFDQDFHFILNLALDSGQFNAANGITNSPSADWPGGYMEIEWVRAYTLENDPWPLSFGVHPNSLKNNHGN